MIQTTTLKAMEPQKDSSSEFLPFIEGWLPLNEVIGDPKLRPVPARFTDDRIVAFYKGEPYMYSDDGRYLVPFE